MTPLALTAGEPAGIGPDLAVLWAQADRDVDVTVIADPDVLLARARLCEIPLRVVDGPTRRAGELTVQPLTVKSPVEPGRLDAANADFVLATLNEAIDGCLEGRYRGLVTGPIQKSIINDAGVAFSGHTEYLADRCEVPQVVMLLVAAELRVALATTHVPLRQVPDLMSQSLIVDVLTILESDLVSRFGIRKPRILVAGLNPHAGEGGHLGHEDAQIIGPALDAARQCGLDVVGPLPADTLFTGSRLAQADAVLAMYHDQGLPVLKALGFGAAVNVTLGLPFVRTSVDHGTALDLAGSGDVDQGSLNAAIALAQRLTG